MNEYEKRLRRIEAATGTLPITVGEMTDAQLIRVIVGGNGSQEITDEELQRIVNEPGLTHGSD